MNLNTIKQAQEYFFEFRSKYAGKIFVDLESNQIDEIEAVNRLKKFDEIVTDELKSRFDDLEDDFEIFDIIDFDNIDDCNSISTFANDSLLFVYAIKNESMQLLKYLHNDSKHFRFWSLPISPLEFARKLELGKAVNFLRRY